MAASATQTSVAEGDPLHNYLAQFNSPQFWIAAALGLVALILLARQRFDRPTWITKQLDPVGDTEAFHLTTLDRSIPGLILYIVLLVLLYVLLCGLGSQAATIIGIPPSAAWAWPIAAASAVVGISVTDDKKLLGRLEQVVRKWCHEYALVPHRLQNLAARLDHVYGSLEEKLKVDRVSPEHVEGTESSQAYTMELWHTELLMRALDLAYQSGNISQEFRSEREDEIDRVNEMRQQLADPMKLQEGSVNFYKEAVELNRRARYLLASGLMYGKRSSDDIEMAAQVIGVRLRPEDDAESVPSLVPAYVSGTLLAALSVILGQDLVVWPWVQGFIDRDNVPPESIDIANQILDGFTGIGFPLAVTGVAIYCSAAFWVTRFRDAGLETGRLATVGLRKLHLILKATLVSSLIAFMVAFVMSPIVSIASVIAIISVVLQCLTASVFAVWHFDRAPHLHGVLSRLSAVPHIIGHGIVAASLVAGTSYLALRVSSFDSLTAALPSAISAVNNLTTASQRSGKQGLAAAFSTMQYNLASLNVIASHRMTAPAKSQVYEVKIALERSCTNLQNSIVDALGTAENKAEGELDNARHAGFLPCFTPQMFDTLITGLSTGPNDIVPPVADPLYNLDTILERYQTRNHQPFLAAKWASLLLPAISGALFAVVFSTISIFGRVWQLRGNLHWLEIEKVCPPRFQNLEWKSSLLADCTPLKGWTPLEAAAYETPRKLLIEYIAKVTADEGREDSGTDVSKIPLPRERTQDVKTEYPGSGMGPELDPIEV